MVWKKRLKLKMACRERDRERERSERKEVEKETRMVRMKFRKKEIGKEKYEKNEV